MEQILRFVTLANSGRFTVTELCEQSGISGKTGYKHLERYAADATPAYMGANVTGLSRLVPERQARLRQEFDRQQARHFTQRPSGFVSY